MILKLLLIRKELFLLESVGLDIHSKLENRDVVSCLVDSKPKRKREILVHLGSVRSSNKHRLQ